MRSLASISFTVALAVFAVLPAFAQRGFHRAGGWPMSGGAAIAGRPSAVFRQHAVPFPAAPHFHESVGRPFFAQPPMYVRRYQSPGMRRNFPGEAYGGGGRRDWGRWGGRRHHHRHNGPGVGYQTPYGGQVPYFYSYSTYFVPNQFGYPFGFDSFLDGDDYDSFYNGQPLDSGAGPDGYAAGYADGYSTQYPQGREGEYDQAPAAWAAAAPPPASEPYREPYLGNGAGQFSQAPEPLAGSSGAATADVKSQPATTLIFADGRPSEKIYNYIVTPTTLYSFHGGRREEIPVSAINVAATEAANRAAGVDFSLPASAN